LHSVYEDFLRKVHDQWMNESENADTRFLLMGQRDLLTLEELTLIDSISAHTRKRTGMVVGVCLAYCGLTEQDRAMEAWWAAGATGGPKGWRAHLDLPSQDVSDDPFQLIIRTGEGSGEIVHDNEFLHAYRKETRFMYHKTLFPDYTPAMLRADVLAFRAAEQRKGA
jgi:undecaprenyl pyrophosphate synthase